MPSPILALILAALPLAPLDSRTPPSRDFRTDPPRVTSMTLRDVSPGRQRLVVRFAETGLPATLPFFYQGKRRTLREETDGTYSVLVDAGADTSAVAKALSAPEWQPQTAYVVGTLVTHLGSTYECLQAHTSQPGWEPPNVPALWELQQDGALDPEKTLLIRDTSVVDSSRTSDPCQANDPAEANRKWTFGYLMTQIANTPVTGRTASDVALSLLRQWETSRTVNGEVVPARPAIRQRITDKWLRASGNNGTLAMHKAPFRLLAIVNRVDLRQNLFFGEGLAGELRFVWGVLDLENRAADGTCQPDSSFTVIMEFAVDKADPDAVKAWGRKWVDLEGLDLTSEGYRTALESLTESVVRAGVGAPRGRANGSALIRIRTNEISLAFPWELRELEIARAGTANAGRFVEVTVKQTPAGVHNRTPLLARFVNDQTSAILADRHNVPLTFEGARFRGGASLNNIDFWDADGIVDKRARHIVSLNTCNGCHGAETATGFLHVFPRPRSSPATLSGFLTGVDVVDPSDPSIRRHMNDLFRRAVDLRQLTSSPTLSQLSFQPLDRTH